MDVIDEACLQGRVDSMYGEKTGSHSDRVPGMDKIQILGKRVGDVIEENINLNNKRPKLKGKEISNAPLEKVEPQNVEFNSSTDSNPRLQRIMGLIEDVGIRKIGIWGMGGIGKTRTLKLLNNRLEESHMFDIVIWVTVSGEGSRRKVQNDVAERLKCTKKDMSDNGLRAFISNKLSGKKFLLILDDIWEKIDLSEVGIPNLNQDNGCKVLLTTRKLSTCQRMETDEEIKMEKLSQEEAWSLFNEKVGDVAMSPEIEGIARDIIEKCDGLPLAIIVIGSSLRKRRDIAVWTNTLTELKSPPTCQIEGMEEVLFSCLRISYKRLSGDFQRNLFLYCSLYPEDCEIVITELAEYYWLEGNMEGVDSIKNAWNKGCHMVSNLIDASLLERGNDEKHIKMHDMLRLFALNEASGFLIKTGKHVKHPPEEKEWLQSQKISLMGCSLVRLLKRPNCSTLSILLLQDNDQLTVIPDSFFEYMHSLRIVDLSRTGIKSLPSSLWNVVNLRGLYLKDCRKLEELPSQVGALKQLEVLDFGGNTTIRYLPREVGELTRLKRLIVGFKECEWQIFKDDDDEDSCSEDDDHEDTKKWNMKLRVPTGIIPKLPLLEELSLYVPPVWENGTYQWDDESMEVVVKEMCTLEHLTYLDAYFPKVKSLKHFLRHSLSLKDFPKVESLDHFLRHSKSFFRRFRFRVGTEEIYSSVFYSGDKETERCLVYNGRLGMSHATIKKTLARCSVFHLHEDRTIRKLSELGLANIKELKECKITDSDKMENLFDGDEQQESLLPNLESLCIERLPEWRSLCDGPLLPGSLSKLTRLLLFDCKKLKKVFQLDIIQQLCSLESLEVWTCSTVEEIIEIEEEEEMSVASHTHNDRLILPNIKEIYLMFLPELESICRGFSNFEWPSLERIIINECPKLKSLSFLSNGTDIVAPALREIYGSISWWEALEWEDNDIKQQLQPFFTIDDVDEMGEDDGDESCDGD
ncbi:putative disease resistance protein [Cinnamomum micranthum f. kanehirae]|uniref:Putative disease resistance protein n=1 Tax=Cinnamomum micranthum f. kanehirae TaxID=337451 RepID=A0A3S4N5H1_9MAGN|nr:putative disease resistance protein [Cinnamomum micranthum f. kanehirae]